MMKIFLWIVSLLFAMTLFVMAEENDNMLDVEESLESQCDLQYNICMDKCGDEVSDECVVQCKDAMEQCYAKEDEEQNILKEEN